MERLNWLSRFRITSIKHRLILGIALVHAVMMTFFVFDLVNRERAFLIQESRAQALALAHNLAINGSSWVLSQDLMGIEELIDSQREYPGLRYAMFSGPDGQVLGYTDRSQVGRYLDDPVSRHLLDPGEKIRILIDDAELIDIARAVEAQERQIGWARVGLSRSGINENLRVVTLDGILYTLVAIGLGVIFGALMGRSLTGDIYRMVTVAKCIDQGERDVRCAIDRPDELGTLAKGIDSMLVSLTAREQELTTIHERVARDEERLRFALEGSGEGLWDWDIESGLVYTSPRWNAMLGYLDDKVINTFDAWKALLHPDDRDAAIAAINAHINGEQPNFEIVFRLRHQDQGWCNILSRGRALRDGDGNAYRMVGTHVDITELKRLKARLTLERERALVTLNAIGDGVISTQADGRVDYLNPVAESLTGWSNAQARAQGLSCRNIFPLANELTMDPVDCPVERALQEDRLVKPEPHTVLVRRQGEAISVETSANPIRDPNGQVIGAVLVFHDSTDSRHMQRQIEQQATHDALTGLWNRRAFDRRLAELTKAAMEGAGDHVLIYIDLDQFKVVNDTVGHAAGDEMLRQIATLLGRHVRRCDMLARLGGDEFGLLLTDCDEHHGQAIAERQRTDLSSFRFIWRNQTFQAGASFGLVHLNPELLDPNVLSLADLACYRAKETGRNRIHIYRPDDDELHQQRGEMQWVTRTKRALEKGQLVLYAQPIRPLKEPSEYDHLEVLVRMQDPSEGLIPPDRFIPAAEHYGLMPEVDREVFRQSCDWLKHPEHSHVFLSINLSGASLGDSAVLDLIEQRLDEQPDLAHRLCLEITETAAIGNLRDALEFMTRLKARRVSFALDDFGIGLSSFSYLKTLPVDRVKIDGCFVRNLLINPVDAAIVEAIARVCQRMGIETVAEYVESEAIMERLHELGVDYAQGFAIAKPSPLSPTLTRSSAKA